MSHLYEEFERASDSVMARNIDGRIRYWNSGAENLYGWTRQEAVGKVSHSLLRTRFPKPLQEIESELMQNGIWEGRLIHTTRDGRSVIVKSRWSLELDEQAGPLLEINRPCADPGSAAEAARSASGLEPPAEAEIKRSRAIGNDGPAPFSVILAITALLAAVLALVYGVFGRDLIRALYDGRLFGLGDWLMTGKTTTALQDYYDYADASVLLWIVLSLILVPAGIVLLRQPLGAMVAACSMLLFSFLAFCAGEWFPSVVPLLHLEVFPYYSFKQVYLPDGVLAFKVKPFAHANPPANFKGDLYSPAYGVEAASINAAATGHTWDENGFSNKAGMRSADIVVVGDSYMEDGTDDGDPFPRRLETKLGGVTVANLATAGYGPNQYVEVLKRYGIAKKPKYVLMGFFEGNDVDNIVSYLAWKQKGTGTYARWHEALAADTVARKYLVAAEGTLDYVRGRAWEQLWLLWQLFLDRLEPKARPSIHPDIAVLRLGKQQYSVVLPEVSGVQPAREMLQTEKFRVLAQLLAEYKEVSVKNGIVPIVLYIPAATHIYAPHSTDQSGSRWLYRRDRIIAHKDETEKAVRFLSEQHQLGFITLTPLFERAAEQGTLLYYPFDTHWNSQGKELAARFVADALRSRFFPNKG